MNEPFNNEEQTRTRFTQKKIIVCVLILIAIVALLFAFLQKSEFEKVKDEALEISGQLRSGEGYFTIDTLPDEVKNFSSSFQYSTQEKALNAIKYVNTELGFSSSLYYRMENTNALMGVQREENEKYSVSWTYHPDDGLEVTYTEK